MFQFKTGDISGAVKVVYNNTLNCYNTSDFKSSSCFPEDKGNGLNKYKKCLKRKAK